MQRCIFCLDFSVMSKNCLIRKVSLTSKFTHIAQYLKTKGNQTMKFGQLEYNMKWNIAWVALFLKNQSQNVVEKLFPDPFLKNQNWAYLWINSLKLYSFVFIVCQVEGYRNILKLSRRPLAITSYKAFLKNKKMSGTSLPPSFSARVLKKIFL